MAKKLNDKDIKVGSWVAFNMLADATWFKVITRDGFRLTVQEHEGYQPHAADTSMVAQIRKGS